MAKRIGSRTIELTEDVRVAASAAVAGKKEGEGPLKACFDYVSQDSYFAEDSWEKAETSMLRQCFGICRGKAGGAAFEPECVLGGDLLNQCVSSSFALKDSGLPYLGLYGACSTMAEALCHAAYARAVSVFGEHHAARTRDRPLARRCALPAVFEREAVLPLRRAEVRAGERGGGFEAAAVYQQRRETQCLRHR